MKLRSITVGALLAFIYVNFASGTGGEGKALERPRELRKLTPSGIQRTNHSDLQDMPGWEGMVDLPESEAPRRFEEPTYHENAVAFYTAVLNSDHDVLKNFSCLGRKIIKKSDEL